MANTKGEKELYRTWPNTSGLVARTTKQEGRQTNLTPQGHLGVKTRVLERNKIGIQ